MKVSRRKTEYMCVNETGDGEMVLLQGVEVPKVKEFRYLGSTDDVVFTSHTPHFYGARTVPNC